MLANIRLYQVTLFLKLRQSPSSVDSGIPESPVSVSACLGSICFLKFNLIVVHIAGVILSWLGLGWWNLAEKLSPKQWSPLIFVERHQAPHLKDHLTLAKDSTWPLFDLKTSVRGPVTAFTFPEHLYSTCFPCPVSGLKWSCPTACRWLLYGDS